MEDPFGDVTQPVEGPADDGLHVPSSENIVSAPDADAGFSEADLGYTSREERVPEEYVPPSSAGAAQASPSSYVSFAPSSAESKGDELAGCSPLLPLTGRGRYTVTVTDPENRGEGMKAYTVYKVNTSDDGRPEASVARRFSDFIWLAEQLGKRFRGIIVPPLPDKSVTGRFNSEFIQERRRGVELFLNRVLAQSDLASSEDLHTFLFADEAALAKARAVKDKGEKKGGLMSFLKESAHAIAGAKERAKTEQDLALEAVAADVEQLERLLAALHAAEDTLVARTKAVSKAKFELGLAATLLGQYENAQKNDTIGLAFCQLGVCADRLSAMLNCFADAHLVGFREPLHYYLRLLASVKAVLKNRAAAQLTAATSKATLESRVAALEKLKAAAKQDAKKLAAQEKAVADAQAEADEAAAELERVTASALGEVARWRAEKAMDLRTVVTSMVRAQAAQAKRVAATWEEVLANLTA